MNRFAAALVCLLVLPACRKAEEPPPQPAPQKQTEQDDPGSLENDNLLNIVFGAAVVDRSDELSYEASVAHALDGTRRTPWVSAPGGKQTAILSLAAPTRITRVGASVINDRGNAPAAILFETSLDGTTWTRAVEARLKHDDRLPQLFDIAPVVARYLRVSAIEPAYQSHILSLIANGTETAPVTQPSIEGCWEINSTVPARFVRAGARITGTIGPMVVDGGTDGRVYRLMWLEKMMWGYAAVSISADGQHLSGVRWHEEVNPKNSGDGWIGKRVPCEQTIAINTAKVVDDIIRRATVWRLYGVRLDAQDKIVAAESANALDLAARVIREHPNHRFRIVAREFRESTEEKNRARCNAKLEAIREALTARGTDLARIDFVVAGSERGPLSVDFTSLHVMDSGVELQVLPSR